MEEMDHASELEQDDEELLMKHVVQGDHELLYLDSYLQEAFRPTDDSN